MTRTQTAEPTTEPTAPEPTAERPSAARIAERTAWSERRVEMQQRIVAIDEELASEVVPGLDQARLEAVAGEDRAAAIGSLLSRQRALEAERDELASRIELAMAKESEVNALVNEAVAIEAREDRIARAHELRAAGEANDAALIDHVKALRRVLRERTALDIEIRALRESDPHALNGILVGTEHDGTRFATAMRAADPDDDSIPRLRIQV